MSLALAVILSIITFSSGPDNADILAAFGRADVYAEKAYVYYCRMHNYLLREYKAGKTDIEKEDWDENVVPWATKAVMNMDQAMAELESVMPDKIKKGFWEDVYYEVWDSWKLDTDAIRKLGFYQSEYTMRISGFPNYLYMYLAVIDGKFKSIEQARNKLQKLAKSRR